MKQYEQKLLPSLTGKLWLLAALFLVLLPHLLRMPVILSLGCVAVFGWRLAHELKGWSLPRRPLRWVITLMAFSAVALLFKTIVGRDAGVALLSVMLCLKLLELRTLRDSMVTLYIGYFLVIGAFLFSQSIYTGGYLLLVVLLLTAALLALNHPQSSTRNTRFYLRYSGQLLLQAFPLMVVMFLLFPRLSGPLWSMPDDKPAARTGLSDEMNMGTVSNLAESNEVAFRVDFNGPIPAASKLYWRGPVLWKTNGRRWQRMSMQMGTEIPDFEVVGDKVTHTVTLEPSDKSWLFSLDLPMQLPQGLEDPVFVRPDFQLLAWKPVTRQQRYTITSALSYRFNLLPEWQRKSALQLPADLNPKTIALASQWRQSTTSDLTILNLATAYFKDQPFYYTRQPPLLTKANPVDQFLFTERRGFCEHYASAMVTLMRAAGIPSRLILGYQGGERNNFGNYLIVRQSHAHAWAEVWLENSGWTRVDPTSFIPDERIENNNDTQRFLNTDLVPVTAIGGGFAPLTRAYWKILHSWDAVNHYWDQWVLGFDKEQQEKLLKRLGFKDIGWENLITLLIISMILLVTVISTFVLLKRPRQTDPVQRHYQRFCDKLAKQGTVRAINEGPQDFAQRACRELPHLCEQITEITRRYIALRYQQQKEAKDLRGLRQAVQQFG